MDHQDIRTVWQAAPGKDGHRGGRAFSSRHGPGLNVDCAAQQLSWAAQSTTPDSGCSGRPRNSDSGQCGAGSELRVQKDTGDNV